MKHRHLMSLCSIVAVFALILTACSTSSTPDSTTSTTTTTSSTPADQGAGAFGLGALPGYEVTLFTSLKPTDTYSNADSVVDDGTHIFVSYQNVTAKDCTDHLTSTIVEYNLDGSKVKTFTVPGHTDGMREDPSTHLLWVTDCEDGNPQFVTVDPSSGTITPYSIPPTVHGGGVDDLCFVNGMTFLAMSNPNLDAAGVNVFPAIDQITLSSGKVVLTPVLMGNTTATDLISNSKVTLNEVDPDSMTVNSQGQLVLVNQGGNELVFLKNPGTPQQQVSRVSVGDQLDDTVWATSTKGRLLVVDKGGNVFWISAPNFIKGTVYTQAPNDSGTGSFVGIVDLTTGFVTPIIVGFVSPTGMLFVPNS